MTTGEIAAWGALAVAVIGALTTGVVNIIVTLRESKFSRQREYRIHDAVKAVERKAEDAYQEANHRNVKLESLSARLIEQGKLAEHASEVLPQVQQTIEATKAAVETAAAATEETKALAQDLTDKLVKE